METVSAALLWEMFKHARQWLTNLRRAGQERKLQSRQAVRRVITAARETVVYVRQLEETGQRDHHIEKHLSLKWTELGFELEDLGIKELAEKCQIKGKHWSDPNHFQPDFLKKADVSLDRMEQLAQAILNETDH